MGVASSSEVVFTLEKAGQGLHSLVRDSELEIAATGREFEDLARRTDALLDLAAAIVGCVQDENVESILPKVQSLGASARLFIQDRLQATTGILETSQAEGKLLDRLSEVTRKQKSIARETQTLSVLTNIEVARLGQLGAGFQYLAHQLDEFSESVTTGTKDLSRHIDERKTSMESTRRLLSAGLPRIREGFARIEEDLDKALAVAANSQAQLAQAPLQFQASTQEIAAEVAGVVSAVQAYDITRQQLEHVQDALGLMAAGLRGMETAAEGESSPLPWIAAGLEIQTYQLRNIRETVGNWVSQIGACMDALLRISSSDVGAIGPMVLAQAGELTSQLARIELLEQECQTDNQEVQSAFSGLLNLMELVGESLKKSKSVRDRLQLLSFNSIIESNHLGSQADAILEISQSIKRISVAWSELTDRSGQVMTEILQLVEQARTGMEAFSEASNDRLREAQQQTKSGVEHLRAAAGSASGKANEIENATADMQSKIASVSATAGRLKSTLGSIGNMLDSLEEAKRELDRDYPGAQKRCDRKEVEAMFAVSYTTEVERAVLRAALDGAPMPVAQQSLAGNDVEFF
jgi:methyl-accepting chemotaxis protein